MYIYICIYMYIYICIYIYMYIYMYIYDQQFGGGITINTINFKAMPTRHFGIRDQVQPKGDFNVTPAVHGVPPCVLGSLGVPGNTSRKMLTEPPLFNACGWSKVPKAAALR